MEDVEACDRVVRLMRGGPRTLRPIPEGGRNALACWGVFLRGDQRRRPMAQLNEGQFEALCASGQIVSGDRKNEFVLSDDGLKVADRNLCQAGAFVPSVWLEQGTPTARTIGFSRLIEQMKQDEGPLTHRLMQAADRLIRDAEPAMRGDVVARSISMTQIEGGERSSRMPSGVSAMRARRRLAALGRACDKTELETAWRAVVQQESFAGLARWLGCKPAQAPTCVCQALEAVALAYDAMGPAEPV